MPVTAPAAAAVRARDKPGQGRLRSGCTAITLGGPVDSSPHFTRRHLVLGAGAGAGAVALAACSGGPTGGSGYGAGAGASSGSASGAGSAGSPRSAGGGAVPAALADIPVGTGVVTKNAAGAPIVVARPTAGTAAAFSAICTHLGCTVASAGKQLDCPCHGSQYNAAPETTLPSTTCTATARSGLGAGPLSTAPVAALYCDPWQGQSNCLPAAVTVQPRWVQMALNAAVVPAVGRATTIRAPAASLVTTPVPPGLSASAAGTAPPADAVPDPADPAPEADPLDAPAPAP